MSIELESEEKNPENQNVPTYKTTPSHKKKSKCQSSGLSATRPITKSEIKAALKSIYALESEPVDVKSVKRRTGYALLLLTLGSIMLAGVIGYRFLGFEQNLMLFSLIIMLIAIPTGFLLSTKYIRKIYFSMSRFKDDNSPSYRRVFPNTRFQTHGLIYATLLCLIILGIQSTNFLPILNDSQNLDEELIIDEPVTYTEGSIWLDNVILGAPKQDFTGQYYREVIVEINNSLNYHDKNLFVVVESYFVGDLFDTANDTLDKSKDNILIVAINIHEPDDTIIKIDLNLRTALGIRKLDWWEEPSENDIYISDAYSIIYSKEGLIGTKYVEITVKIYNDGIARKEETLSVIVSTPSYIGPEYRDSKQNNKTLYHGEFWVVKFRFDILAEESKYEVRLNIDEEIMDKAEVRSE